VAVIIVLGWIAEDVLVLAVGLPVLVDAVRGGRARHQLDAGLAAVAWLAVAWLAVALAGAALAAGAATLLGGAT
jgi:hypothetical protein